MVAGIWSSVGGGVFVNSPPRCRWRWSVSMPGLLIHRAVIADVDVVKIVVLLRSPNFHRHCGDWLPRNLTVFLAAMFLENCPSLLPSCESSKCRVIWSRVNARRHRPPPTSASPLARFGQRDGPAMRRRLRLSRLLLSGCRWPRASQYSDEPRWPRCWSQSTGLTADYMSSPANAMIDVTQVVLLSVRQELRSRDINETLAYETETRPRRLIFATRRDRDRDLARPRPRRFSRPSTFQPFGHNRHGPKIWVCVTLFGGGESWVSI